MAEIECPFCRVHPHRQACSQNCEDARISAARTEQREQDAEKCDAVARRYSGGTFNDSSREVRAAEECATAIREREE